MNAIVSPRRPSPVLPAAASPSATTFNPPAMAPGVTPTQTPPVLAGAAGYPPARAAGGIVQGGGIKRFGYN